MVVFIGMDLATEKDETVLEKEAEELLAAGKRICDEMSNLPALYSIAISLKRIADKLELSQRQPIIMSAEEHIKYKEYENARSGND